MKPNIDGPHKCRSIGCSFVPLPVKKGIGILQNQSCKLLVVQNYSQSKWFSLTFGVPSKTHAVSQEQHGATILVKQLRSGRIAYANLWF